MFLSFQVSKWFLLLGNYNTIFISFAGSKTADDDIDDQIYAKINFSSLSCIIVIIMTQSLSVPICHQSLRQRRREC